MIVMTGLGRSMTARLLPTYFSRTYEKFPCSKAQFWFAQFEHTYQQRALDLNITPLGSTSETRSLTILHDLLQPLPCGRRRLEPLHRLTNVSRNERGWHRFGCAEHQDWRCTEQGHRYRESNTLHQLDTMFMLRVTTDNK